MRTEMGGWSKWLRTGALLCTIGEATSHCSSQDTGAEPLDDLYVGCRDPGLGTIQHYRISTVTGAVTLVDTVLANAEVSNSAWNANKDILYVAHTDTGRITTFARNATTGTLTLKGFVSVPGMPTPEMNPATQTLEVDHSGKFLLAANYAASTVVAFAINADGSVGNLLSSVEDGMNAHHTVLDAANKFALVPYLGSNLIAVYHFDEMTGALTNNTPATVEMPAANSGPRHLALHQNDKWLYAITETAGSIVFFLYDGNAGTLTPEDTVSSLPASFTGTARSGSEIAIDRTGHFLYVSNRLDQMASGILGAYSISQTDGKLTPIDFYDSHGATPRQFSLSPGGELLVVGNQSSANMSVFKVSSTGALTYVATTSVCNIPFFAQMAAP
jgi:6-phosphogluconolactonase